MQISCLGATRRFWRNSGPACICSRGAPHRLPSRKRGRAPVWWAPGPASLVSDEAAVRLGCRVSWPGGDLGEAPVCSPHSVRRGPGPCLKDLRYVTSLVWKCSQICCVAVLGKEVVIQLEGNPCDRRRQEPALEGLGMYRRFLESIVVKTIGFPVVACPLSSFALRIQQMTHSESCGLSHPGFETRSHRLPVFPRQLVLPAHRNQVPRVFPACLLVSPSLQSSDLPPATLGDLCVVEHIPGPGL